MAENPVRYEVRDGVAVITIDNPPLNVLSRGVREELLSAIGQASKDGTAQALVISGAGRTFTAGADISEFGISFKGPDINDIASALEDFPKPVVVALHGTPLGGGVEISLACHYRVAHKDARLGLPEVKLGLLPGGGGTQRLPRLTGAKAALDMIVSGDPVPAAMAKQTGFVDEVVDGDHVQAAIAFAKAKVHTGRQPKTRERMDKIEADRHSTAFDEKRAEIKKAKPGQHAPLRCVDAIEAAFQLPFDEGLKRERELFTDLLQGEQGKALVHVFFAQREAAKVPGIGPEVRPREVRSVGIIGSGTMGGGIAMAFVNAGIPVVVMDRDQATLDRGLGVVRKNYENMVQRGRLDHAGLEARLNSINPTLNYSGLADVDLVIEAAFEDLAVKEQVFGDLDRACKPGAILATNTSTLDIDKIAGFTSRPGDVIGMHFFSPAHIMRLLENVRGAKTAPDVIATAMTLGRKIGKVSVLAGNCDGFIGNRMLDKYVTEAMKIVEEGTSPADVDAALTGFGMAMGPFAVGDLAGLDVSWNIRKRRLAEGRDYSSALIDRFYEAGRLGQKTGKGYYRYEPGSRTPLPDAEADAIIAAYRNEIGAVRSGPVPDMEIVKRMTYALVNEGANILEEGIALRSGDIDITYIYGYGFPAWRGGPMKYAELRGLAEVLSEIDMFHKRFGQRWKPAHLLKAIVAEGKRKWPH